MVTAQMVKELREKTGAGMMSCKKALVETDGNMEKAIEFLREKGLAAAAKRASRKASEGIVHAYIHQGGKVGVLLELNCETDFVAKNKDFKALAHDLAMQVAAMNPGYIDKEEVPAEVVEKEKQILLAQAVNEGKPEHIAEKMVEGRIEKFYKQNCLLLQPYVKDGNLTVNDVVIEAISRIGENIKVGRFVRFAIGENVEE